MHQKTQNHFLRFSTHLSVRKSRANYRQIYGKSKESLWRNLSTPPNFFRTILCFVPQFTSDILFRTAVLWKLFDIRFSYNHCNFSRVCLLVKMASKTVTRFIHCVSTTCAGNRCVKLKTPRGLELGASLAKSINFLWAKFGGNRK